MKRTYLLPWLILEMMAIIAYYLTAIILIFYGITLIFVADKATEHF
jgi:hypothetical protein